MFGYLHGVRSPIKSPHGASIRLFRGCRRGAEAYALTRIRARAAEGEGSTVEEAGRNGISVLRRPAYGTG